MVIIAGGRGNEIRRDAPALLLFPAGVTDPSMDESCSVAVTYAMLMAECLGLGSVVGYPRLKLKKRIPRACGTVPYLGESGT